MFFSHINSLGPRLRNDLDFKYSHIFKNSISCLSLITFRSQAAIVSEKGLFLGLLPDIEMKIHQEPCMKHHPSNQLLKACMKRWSVCIGLTLTHTTHPGQA